MNFLFGTILALKITFAVCLVSILAALVIRVVGGHEKGVLFRAGRLLRPADPGVVFMLPIVDRLEKVDMREFHLEIPRFYVRLKDQWVVPFELLAVFRVDNPSLAVLKVRDYEESSYVHIRMIAHERIEQLSIEEVRQRLGNLEDEILRLACRRLGEFGVTVTSFDLQPVQSGDL